MVLCFMAVTQPAIKFGVSANTEDDEEASAADVPAPAKPAAASPSGWGTAFLQASPALGIPPMSINVLVPVLWQRLTALLNTCLQT